MKSKLLNIEDNKLYKPREIAELGVITNSTGRDNAGSNYFFILNMINSGKIKARNYGTGSRKYWLVLGSEIKNYLNSWSN